MKETTEFINLLRQYLQQDLASPLFLAEVLEVKGSVVDLQPLDDSPKVRDARLCSVVKEGQAGLLVKPAVGSIVLALYLDKSRNTAFVILAFDVAEYQLVVGTMSLVVQGDKITFNQGLNGGLVLVEELVKRLNALEDRINTHQHQYINAAGAPTPTTALPGVLALEKTTALQIANPEIVQ